MNLFIVVEVRKMYVLLELEKVKKNSYEEYFWQNKSIFVGECFFDFTVVMTTNGSVQQFLLINLSVLTTLTVEKIIDLYGQLFLQFLIFKTKDPLTGTCQSFPESFPCGCLDDENALTQQTWLCIKFQHVLLLQVTLAGASTALVSACQFPLLS